MRTLFSLDKKDYDPNGTVAVRDSARAIIIRGGKIVMIHGRARDYCKLPGGGIDPGEEREQALVREVAEETGLTVVPESIREYGVVSRRQRGRFEGIFIQDNYYYFCDAVDNGGSAHMEDYELAEDFVTVEIDPREAIAINDHPHPNGEGLGVMLERESRILQLLIDEGYFN